MTTSTQLKDDLIINLGIESLSIEQQDEVITLLGQSIFQDVFTRIKPIMPDRKLVELEQVADSGNLSNLEAFIENNIPSFTKIFESVAKEKISEIKDFLGSYK